MAVNLEEIIDNLLGFYDFKDKTVISIGAGGGQFYEYAFKTKRVIAVDNDKGALENLKESIRKENLFDKFRFIHADFYSVKEKADLLMFDFCLHEIPNPKKAIQFALTMSSDILINDHWVDSEWAYIVNEEEKVRKSWAAIEKFKIRKKTRYDTFQFFRNYKELFDKVKGQGDNSISRIKKYQEEKDIIIPMSYGMVLI